MEQQLARTAADVTPEEMRVYRETLRRRDAEDRAAAEALRTRALEAARAAAHVLRERYGATRVMLFGSLARDEFWPTSDIDLIAWGIASEPWLRVGIDAESVAPGFAVDVVLAQDASERLLADVERDGVELR